MRPEHRAEELGRHFVVLLVRLFRQQRQRRFAQRVDEGLGLLGGCGGIAALQLDQARLQQTAYAEAHDAIGHEALFDPIDGYGGAVGHVLSAPVCWATCPGLTTVTPTLNDWMPFLH